MPDNTASSHSDFLLQEVEKLTQKVKKVVLPPELKENVELMIRRVANLFGSPAYAPEYESISSYIDWVTNLPWTKESEDNLDLDRARQILDQNHYGMEQVKERVLEYLAVLNLQDRKNKENQSQNPLSFRNNVLCLVGLPGIGKTTVAKSIAESLGRKFVRIPFGGMGSAILLRGQSKVFADAEPGLVIKNLRRAQTSNPVILLDEIDRSADSVRAEIMGVLLELLDPEQNNEYRDHYVDFPFDLSKAMFIATCNNTGGIANAVLDRLEIIQMPSYSDEEKMEIARNYLFPKELVNVGLTEKEIQIDDNVWGDIIRPLGFDAGVRTLSRTIQGICRKVAKKIVLGEGQSFRITSENIAAFLPEW